MNTPLLEGFGIRMEPVDHRHIPALQAISDPTVWRYMPLRMESERDLGEWLEHSIHLDRTTDMQVWVTCLASGEVVGSSRLLDLNQTHRTAEVGFSWLASHYRGSGINPRAKLLQLTHAFDGLGVRRVALKTHHANLQSQRAMLKLGAQYEGTFRNHMIMPDGSTRHTAWYSITAEEWPAVQAGLRARLAAQPLPAT